MITVHICSSAIIADETEVLVQPAWSEEELDSSENFLDKCKAMMEKNIDKYFDFIPYYLKYPFLDHMMEDIQILETLYVLYSNPAKHCYVYTKQVYRRTL